MKTAFETDFALGSQVVLQDLEDTTAPLIEGTIVQHFRFTAKNQFCVYFKYRGDNYQMCFSKKSGLGYGPSMMKSKVQVVLY